MIFPQNGFNSTEWFWAWTNLTTGFKSRFGFLTQQVKKPECNIFTPFIGGSAGVFWIAERSVGS